MKHEKDDVEIFGHDETFSHPLRSSLIMARVAGCDVMQVMLMVPWCQVTSFAPHPDKARTWGTQDTGWGPLPVSVTSVPQLGQQRLWGSQQRQQQQQSVNSRQRLAEDKQRRVSEVIRSREIWILAPNEAHRHRHGGDGDGGQ